MLSVVTCLFNSANFQRPLRNYHRFAARLKRQCIPLFTLELAFGDSPFLLPRSPDTHQARSQSILWQKERLLNEAVRRLPPHVDKILWADADVLFEDGGVERVAEALKHYDVVQAFDRAYRLFPDQREFSILDSWGNPLWEAASVMKRHLHNQDTKDAAFGFAWAAKRSFFDKVGMYERAILGGGDTLLRNALMGIPQPAYLPAVHKDITRWTDSVRSLGLRAGYVSNRLCHLWHGDQKNRRYWDRHEILVRHGFDPLKDIRAEGPCYEWASPKTGLHQEVRDYFLGRKEDG